MTAFCMPRTNWKFRLDDRIIEALKLEAEHRGLSFNAYVESLLLAHGKAIGRISVDAEPDPDLRGGKRPNAGRPKAKPDDYVAEE
jgi:hypothetical protein